MLGVSSPPTISNWKKRYLEGAAMDIPEIDPDEIVVSANLKLTTFANASRRMR